MNSMVLIT